MDWVQTLSDVLTVAANAVTFGTPLYLLAAGYKKTVLA